MVDRRIEAARTLALQLEGWWNWAGDMPNGVAEEEGNSRLIRVSIVEYPGQTPIRSSVIERWDGSRYTLRVDQGFDADTEEGVGLWEFEGEIEDYGAKVTVLPGLGDESLKPDRRRYRYAEHTHDAACSPADDDRQP
jgi:hypothetical protein